MTIELFHGDCLDILPTLKRVDLIIADMPYGTTACSWDSCIDLDRLWPLLLNLVNIRTPILLNASQPFTAKLICSNLANFKYCWHWNKVKPSTGLFAKKAPLLVMEDVVVFSRSPNKLDTYYYPIMIEKKLRVESKYDRNGEAFGNARIKRVHDNKGLGFPKNLLEISNADQRNRVHPTQKPIQLLKYLVATYSKEGDTVLDFCMGSGTTGVACKELNRNFIGIEKQLDYFVLAKERIQ